MKSIPKWLAVGEKIKWRYKDSWNAYRATVAAHKGEQVNLVSRPGEHDGGMVYDIWVNAADIARVGSY